MQARRYGIGVGKAGLVWEGTAEVGRKAEWPFWKPTAKMIKRNPRKYLRYANGLRGGRKNPLGSRAIYLYRDGQDTMYRIHGTTEPWTIGRAVSNGCIRMVNEHVEDLLSAGVRRHQGRRAAQVTGGQAAPAQLGLPTRR